jgi:carbon storage regulator CsrA
MYYKERTYVNLSQSVKFGLDLCRHECILLYIMERVYTIDRQGYQRRLPMLVLSRKSGERIRIGAEIEVSVLRIHGNRVEVGISAPRSLSIRREDTLLPGNPFAEEPELVSVLCQLHSATSGPASSLV